MEKLLNIEELSAYVNCTKLMEFIKSLTKNTEKGKYVFDNKISVNVVSYTTESEESDIFEAHKNTTDIHYIIDGEEKIVIGKNAENPTEPYDEENDGGLYKTEKVEEVCYTNGQAILIKPNELHMAGYIASKQEEINKAIIKVCK